MHETDSNRYWQSCRQPVTSRVAQITSSGERRTFSRDCWTFSPYCVFFQRGFDFVPNQQSIHNRIRDRRISVFGHVRRLQESVPAHEALRPHGCQLPCRSPTWWQTGMETSSRLSHPDKPGSASWRSMSGSLQMLLDRDVWRAQQPIAGQAVQW